MTVNQKLIEEAVLHTEYEPDVRINLIRKSGAVLFEYIGGSIAYATNLPTSDSDLRGIFCMPPTEYLRINPTFPKGSLSDDRKIEGQKSKNDNIFYTLHRFFELLLGSNPNILEALWMPDDCVISSSPEMKVIIDNRNLFISKACLGSHFGYAKAQIDKARGKNKKVNNPCSQEMPKKMDFCRIFPCIPGADPWTHPNMPFPRMPFRPIPIKDMPWIDLKDYHIAAVEHIQNAYRLYCYVGQSNCKGVFRGDDMLVCESIPKEDEHTRFIGILQYDEHEYQAAVRAWKSYWNWVENRNDQRWASQEGGLVDYDAKNMMHCVRLLYSGLNIVKNGAPLVRFEGEKRQHLMDVRNGKLSYEDVMADVEQKILDMETTAKTSSIPDSIDKLAVERLYSVVSELAYERLYRIG